ncbi:RGS12 [Acrasis kona]|uniref:RGS12 n=1 Tax=Acrasis kona TaxID=1008807 RepID=A0AAW2Z885_9EUKA
MKEVTTLKPGFLDGFLTNKNVSVGKINKKHKILLLFLRHSRCCFCQEAIADIAENYTALVKYNTIPILVHMENPSYFSRFLENFAGDNEIIKNMVTVHDEDNVLSDTFGIIKQASRIYSGYVISRALTSQYKSRPPIEGGRFLRVPSLFIIDDGVVLKEFRHVHMAQKPDYIRVLVDPDSVYAESELEPLTAEDEECPNLVCALPPIQKPTPSNPSVVSCSIRSPQSPTEDIDLDHVLKSKSRIKYFHMHAAKVHNSENLLFWSAVQKFDESEDLDKRTELATKIIHTFFDSKSMLEINTTDSGKKDVIRTFNEEGPVVDLFKQTSNEVYYTLLHLYENFKESSLFTEMLKKAK